MTERNFQQLSPDLPNLLVDPLPDESWDDVRRAIANTAIGVHMAILRRPYLVALLDGIKTIESRFSQSRIAPWGKVAVGDAVMLKEPGGPVCGWFTASSVTQRIYGPDTLYAIREEHGDAIGAPPEYWDMVSARRHATLIGVGEPKKLQPAHVYKEGQSAWQVFRQAQQPMAGDQATDNRLW